MLTLNEKLNIIADLEAEKLSEELIESILEQVEHPEPHGKRYATVKELMDDLRSDED